MNGLLMKKWKDGGWNYSVNAQPVVQFVQSLYTAYLDSNIQSCRNLWESPRQRAMREEPNPAATADETYGTALWRNQKTIKRNARKIFTATRRPQRRKVSTFLFLDPARVKVDIVHLVIDR